MSQARTAIRRLPWRMIAALAALVCAAIGIRLLAWNWHEFYPLGGDENEYFQQALILLRERRYVELPLMRPPLYTLFLAATIRLVDSLVQHVRLVQAFIGAATVVPMYALAHTLSGSKRVALVAAGFVAFDYTLALSATELLTETLFLFGLTVCLWLLVRGGARSRRTLYAAGAGAALGALILIRSVALPLAPLGALWLLAARTSPGRRFADLAWRPAAAFVLVAALVVAPWTVRNLVTYHTLILVDTTGAENLWLDNDPAGREAVKRQLYALGDDRGLRQQIAGRRGFEAIVSNPGVFTTKAWAEAQKFVALQHFDDLRTRRAIWVPPAEVALRVLFGDGLWLLTLFGGIAGMWLAPSSSRPDPRWVFAPWAGYIFLTAVLFHVELRYRLPLVPAMVPYAAWLVVQLPAAVRRAWHWRTGAVALSLVAIMTLMLLHRAYPAESIMLVRKHIALWQAERAVSAGQPTQAREDAKRALEADPESAWAYVVTARAWLLEGNAGAASEAVRAAEHALPAYPPAHIVHGIIARQSGDLETARRELAFEANSLQDLQRWAWDVVSPVEVAPHQIALGAGLDLGYVRGFMLAEQNYRWTTGIAEMHVSVLPHTRRVRLEMASGYPGRQVPVEILWNGVSIGEIIVAPQPSVYELAVPDNRPNAGDAVVTLRSPTFRPRDLDPASSDGRTLGIQVMRVEVGP